MNWQNWLKRMLFAPKALRSSPIRRRNLAAPRRFDVEVLEARLAPALVINATFAANITNDPNHALIESTINQAIQIYEADISNSITVNITFQEMGTGVGNNNTYYVTETYASYLSALEAQPASAADTTALANLPAGPNLPATLGGGTMINIRAPLARALGYSDASNANIPTDSTISLNTSVCNLSRPASNPNDYDLLAVTLHEMDEAFGGGSALDGLSQGAAAPTTGIEPLDFFRFSAAGVRSFNTTAPTGAANQAYFSIDGGTTDLANFNQEAGGDFGDWYSYPNGAPNPPGPDVQDSNATQGAEPNMGVELTRLDVLGFSVAPSSSTSANTATVINSGSFTAQPAAFVQAGNAVYYVANSQLWEIYPTTNATRLIGGVSNPSDLTAVGSDLYFDGEDSSGRFELYEYDGAILTEITIGAATGTGSSPANLTAVGSDLFFTAVTPGTSNSFLWEYGASGGAEIQVGTSTNPNPTHLTSMGSTLYFAANIGAATQLWQYTGGASASEIAVGNAANPGVSELTAIGSTVYMSARDSSGDTFLWQYGGSGSPAKISVGNYSDPGPYYLTAAGSTLYFDATAGNGSTSSGVQLWQYSGGSATEVATPNSSSPTPFYLTAVGNTIYYLGADNTSTDHLYQYGGSGTPSVVTVGSYTGSTPSDLVAVGNTLCMVMYVSFSDQEVFTYGGSGGAATQITVSSGGDSQPANLSAGGSSLYLGASPDGGSDFEPFVFTPTASSPATPTVQFSAASETLNESAGTFSITVNLSAAAGTSVSVPYTLGGSATNGTDYSGVPAGPLVIPAGQTTGAITGTLLDDPGADQTLIITLGNNPTGATLGSPSSNTLTIDEPAPTPTVQFSAASETLNESAGTFSITVNLSAAVGTSVSVPFTLGGSAANNTDYYGVNGSPLVIPAGHTSGAITGTFLADPGPNQTLTFTLGTPTSGAALGSTSVNTLTIDEPALTSAVFSDSFNRANATEDNLGQADDTLGGSGTYFYDPVFAGASIVNDTLQNNGLDYGGVQFTTSSTTSATRGTNVGQNLDITVSLLAPTNPAGDISEAGVYFRSRAAFTGDGLIGGQAFDPSGGYWVRLLSNGMVEVLDLRNNTITAFTAQPTSFDPTIFHTLQIAANGDNLQVALDGVLQQFDQAGVATTTVAIPPTALPGDTTISGDTSAGDAGTAGIAFGAPLNRGHIGGQEAENLIVSSYRPLSAATNGALLVTNTNDSGAGSLRQAITDSNNGLDPGALIQFAIAESGVQTITPATELPIVTTPVSIEGNTEPFFNVGAPLVDINGTNVPTTGTFDNLGGSDGLALNAGSSTVSGLIIGGFSRGILIYGGSGNLIAGNFIGVAANGTTADGNTGQGVEVANSSSNIIGGTTAADRNIVTGQTSGQLIRFDGSANNLVEGNYIGTNAAGTAGLTVGVGDAGVGISSSSSDNTIGGTSPAAANVISGLVQGVAIDTSSDGNIVEGNLIGTDKTGTILIPNQAGIDITNGASSNIIGGTVPGAGNLIAGNSKRGVGIWDAGTTSNVVEGNFIGTDSTGTLNLGNLGDGVVFNLRNGSPSGNQIGPGNIIAFNAGPGIGFDQGENSALGNAIYSNGDPEILVNGGANNNEPAPTLATAVSSGGNLTVTGSFNAPAAGDTYRVEFFASASLDAAGFSQGQQFIGSQTFAANPAGNTAIDAILPLPGALAGPYFTATVTDTTLGATSPFSYAFNAAVPTVTALVPSAPTITGAQVGSNGFVLTVSYDEPMDTSVAPTIAISAAASTTLTFASGSWDPTHTFYSALYNVANANVSVTNCTVTVSGGQSATDVTQVVFGPVNLFGIDTLAPAVLSATPSTATITNAQVGKTFSISLLYNQAMKTTVKPVISFNPASAAAALTLLSGSWSKTARTYTATYKVTAVATVAPSVAISVSGAESTAANPQVPFSESNLFAIDTAVPTVTSISPSVPVITDAQLGRGAFTLAIQYSTAMNINMAPTVALGTSAATTLSVASQGWDPTETIYTVTYNVADVFVSVPVVTVTVSGAQDRGGNVPALKTGTFAIDTVNPTVKSVTPSVANITGAQEGLKTFSLAVLYSGTMSTAVAPAISFIPPIGTTLTADGAGTWNTLHTIFTQLYDVADSGMLIAGVGVAVSGGENSDGNLQHPFEAVNDFTINTINPIVVSATPSVAIISNAQVGKNDFRMTITYSTPMNAAVAPTIVFAPDVSSTLKLGTGSAWNASHTAYTAVYNVANANVSLTGVEATISGGKSASASLQLVSFQSSPFAISTTTAKGPNISVTQTNTTAGVTSNYFGESFVPTVSGPLTELNVLDILNLFTSVLGQSVSSAGATIEIYKGGINTANPSSSSYDTPAGQLLYSQNFTFTTGNNSIIFTTPPMLTAGQTYLWRVVPNGVATIDVNFATNNPYAQGDTLAGPGFGYDLPFQIFI